MLLLSNSLLSKERKKSFVSRVLLEDMLKFLHEKCLEVKKESWKDELQMRNAFDKLKGREINFEERLAKILELNMASQRL